MFKPDGSATDPWGNGSSLFAEVVPGHRRGQKVLFAAVKTTSDAAVELWDIGQASFNKLKLPPIADLNKKYVFYEIHLNKVEYDYLVTNKLYNQNGQSAFLQSAMPPPAISFPMGTLGDPSANPRGAGLRDDGGQGVVEGPRPRRRPEEVLRDHGDDDRPGDRQGRPGRAVRAGRSAHHHPDGLRAAVDLGHVRAR